MDRIVALCVDDETYRNPELMGLDGERLQSQRWLEVYSTGAEAREGVASRADIAEVWVASSDDVDPINLAATLKSDHPDVPVRLVGYSGDGSLLSRAHAAALDEVLDRPAFARCYADAKRAFSDSPHPAPSVQVMAAPPRSALSSGSGFVMPVVSGSGGAGKSTVAVLGAHIARDMGYRTLLLDCDLQFGDAAVMAGVPDAIAVDEVLANPERFERDVSRDSALTVVAAPARLESAETVVRSLPQLLGGVAQLFDVVICNTGASWAEQHALLLERSSAALFLVDQRASSVRACRHALELCARCGIATGPFRYAVNRCAKGAPLTAMDVSCALQNVPVLELKDGGRDVEDYLGGGGVEELLSVGNELCASLRAVMSQLLPGGELRIPEGVEPPDARRAPKRRGLHATRKRGRRQ